MSPDPEIIFISYSRKNHEVAKQLADGLKERGVHVWIDVRDIKLGHIWDDAVEEGLRNASKMLVLLSPASVASKNVKDEISFALNENKRVIPVMIGQCDAPIQLTRNNRIDWIDKPIDDEFLDMLTEKLKETEGEEESQIEVIPESRKKVSSFIKPVVGRVKAYLLPILAGLAIFPLKYIFEFKGIIYKTPKIVNNSWLQVDFLNTSPDTLKNLDVGLLIHDTTNYSYNFILPIQFDKIPSDQSSLASCFEVIKDKKIRIARQEILFEDEYRVRYPVVIKNAQYGNVPGNTLVSFECVSDSGTAAQAIKTRQYRFYYFIFFHPWISSMGVILGGILIQFLLAKIKAR